VACLLAILSVFAIISKKGGFKKSQDTKKLSTLFAISDTSCVTKIFMADMYENKVLLTKTESGWMVDQQKPAAEYKVKSLLQTLAAVRVSHTVAKQAQQSTIKLLSIRATKVEVYGNKPLFSLFGRPFFTKVRLLKTYYLGDATQNNLGSYALLEGMPEPYVIYKPGFRGYVTPQFSPDPVDWYSQRIFDTKLTRIQSVAFIDFENEKNTFFVEKSGPRTFTLFDAQKNVIMDYDTLLLINMLSEFRDKNYELFLPKLSPTYKDSIIQSKYYKIISLTDIYDKTTTLKLYHFFDMYEYEDEDGDEIDAVYLAYSRDRCYATINDNIDEIFTLQFFHFDRQIQPLSYYLDK
jgi:hypothetical protein